MFDLDPSRPVWIVRKNGNYAVWPREGQFSGPLVTVGGVYEVKGQTLDEDHQPEAKVTAVASSSPFGAYAFPTYSRPHPSSLLSPAVHPPVKRKKGWSKTIIVVSLRRKSGKGTSRRNAKVEYEIVT